MLQTFSTLEPMTRVGFWHPMMRQMDELFDVMTTAVNQSAPASTRPLRYDVREIDDMYVLNFDVPGIARDDLNIELTGNNLQITGQRKYEDNAGKRVSMFRQGINLPEGVQTEQVAADLKDGVLRIAIQKPASVKPNKIKIGDGTTKGFLKNLLGTDKKSKDAIDVKHTASETVESHMAG